MSRTSIAKALRTAAIVGTVVTVVANEVAIEVDVEADRVVVAADVVDVEAAEVDGTAAVAMEDMAATAETGTNLLRRRTGSNRIPGPRIFRGPFFISRARIMERYDRERRSFLFALGGLGVSQMLPHDVTDGRATVRPGGVLGRDEGEHLIHFRDRANVFVKIGATTGSTNVALGTQQVMAGSGIPVHRHLKMDEAFWVLEGSGVVTLEDVRHPFEKGATIFIPRNTWHGFENPQHKVLLLWVVTPVGLDSFFRETCSPVGKPPKELTREQIGEIARKYDTEFR